MEHPIVQKILKDGINSVNLSMLDEKARRNILTDVGEKLYKQGRLMEAIEILSKSGDNERLQKLGELFISEGKIEAATLCFISLKDKDKLNGLAVSCIERKNYSLAAKAYEAADNQQMAHFMRQNFC